MKAYKEFIQVGDTVCVKLIEHGKNENYFIVGKVLAIPDCESMEWVIRSFQELPYGETYYIKDYVFIHLQSKGVAG